MANKPLSAGAKPSQDFVPIEQVRDGILVLKDGSIRTILMASSINIVLKSEDEQAAILGQFQNFLNSLDFSVQIFIQSRELDIRPYLALLEQRHKEQTSDLMKIQVREYIDFVKNFVDNSSIMTKGFYLVIPYSPPAIGAGSDGGGVAGGIKSIVGTKNAGEMHISPEMFEEYRSQIEQRVSVVINGLARTGVRAAQLGTEEVIELFYRLFNIGELDRPIPLGELANT
jgi:hypothetical protein